MIAENFSEKPKRGRPRSTARICADNLGNLAPDGGLRTKVDFIHGTRFLAALKGSPEYFEDIMLATPDELRAGIKPMPRGYRCMAAEAGRCIGAGMDPANIVEFVGEARRAGRPFSDITAQLRAARLGKRAGSAEALFRHLLRAYRDYLMRFPETPEGDIHEAIVRLWNVFQENFSENPNSPHGQA